MSSSTLHKQSVCFLLVYLSTVPSAESVICIEISRILYKSLCYN